MNPARQAVLTRVLGWRPLVEHIAASWALDPWLVLAVVAQESAGNPYAVRPEPGFWRRYGANVLRAAAASLTKRDDHWVQYPDLADASYGLMQCLYVTATELGADLEYPTELCDPAIGLEWGCKKLAQCFTKARQSSVPVQVVRSALLKYNGGADGAYPDKVLAWYTDLQAPNAVTT